MGLISHLKLKVLASVLDSVSDKETVDFLEAFGDKQFGKDKKDYLRCIRDKLALLIVEVNKRILP